MSKCKGCGKEILWAVDADGKRIPLDTKPPVYQFWQVPTKDGVVMRCDWTKIHAVSHFATCPEANRFSKSKRKE